jgi:hypothetical protein
LEVVNGKEKSSFSVREAKHENPTDPVCYVERNYFAGDDSQPGKQLILR